MVQGIVTILEGAAGEQVHALWRRWADEVGPQCVADMSVPHMSYHVAVGDYDLAALRRTFERIASTTTAFEARIAGIGVVANAEGGQVVWLNVTSTPALCALQDALWDDATAAGKDVEMRYERSNWFPHATLAYHRSVLPTLPSLVEMLRADELPRTMAIDNLSVIEEIAEGHKTVLRVPLPPRGA